jgi:hypothetical protein
VLRLLVALSSRVRHYGIVLEKRRHSCGRTGSCLTRIATTGILSSETDPGGQVNESIRPCNGRDAFSVCGDARARLRGPERRNVIPSATARTSRSLGHVDDICKRGSQEALAALSQVARSRVGRTDGLTGVHESLAVSTN